MPKRHIIIKKTQAHMEDSNNVQDPKGQDGRMSDEAAEKALAAKDGINETDAGAEQRVSRHEQLVNERLQRGEGGGIGTLKGGESGLHSAADMFWKNLPLENLPTAGMFYPKGMQLTFRAAEVAEIRHWSTIDSNDMLDMDMKMNFILEKCVRVKGPDGTWMSWEDLIEIDRFYILFCIHEITFPNGENKLMIKFKCPPTCKGDGTYRESVQLKSNMLNLLTIPEELMQYYSPEERCFIKVSTKLNETLRFYLPTIGVSRKIKNIIKDAQQEGGFIDTAFIKVAPYLVKDWRTLDDKKLEALRMDTFRWSKNKTLFIMGISDMMEKAVNLTVKKECPQCHIDLEAPIFFRGGFTIKNLFALSDRLDELI